jgi:hypothetical protein
MTTEQWNKIQELIQDRQSRRARRRNNNQHRPNKLRDDVHFFHQNKYAVGPTTCFRFPRDFAAAAEFIGIQGAMPERNKAKRDKPKLTTDQENAVRTYYAADQNLFDAITAPGYVFTPEI